MPAHLNALFSVEELQEWDQDDGWPYGFTKGCKIMKIPSRVRLHIIENARIKNVGKSQSCMVSKVPVVWKQGRTFAPDSAAALANQATLLYDLVADPQQLAPLADEAVESRLIR